MKRYVRTRTEIDKPLIRYSILGFRNPDEQATLTLTEKFTTLKGVVDYALRIADEYYQVIIRKDEIYKRDAHTEISESTPILIFTDGTPKIAALNEPFRTKVYNQVSKYLDI